MAGNLEKQLLVELECPVCTNFMSPPIRQCANGHSFCDDCYNRLRLCPQCRAPKSFSRCFALENIHSLLRFPCSYNSDGCEFTGRGQELLDHELHCQYSLRDCPLRTQAECNWNGMKKDIEAHCTQQHPESIFFDYRQTFRTSGMQQCRNRVYFFMFSVFNEIFRCTWDLDVDTRLMRFAVYYMGSPLSAPRFSYRITILRSNTGEEAFSLRAPCAFHPGDDQRFIMPDVMMVSYEMVRQFITDSGDLLYTVQLFDRNLLMTFFQRGLPPAYPDNNNNDLVLI